MSLVINTNVASLNAQRSLQSASELNRTAMERLSSGKKINSASDDAAGFAIIERQTSQLRGLNMAIKNANDGLSLLSTIDKASDDITDILQRLRELNIQSKNATNASADLAYLRQESEALVEEIDRIANQTTFNNQKLMDGSLSKVGYVSLGYPYGFVGSGSANDFSPPDNITYVTRNGTVSTTIASVGGNSETAKTYAAKINATTATSGLTAEPRTEGMMLLLGGAVSISINGVNVDWTSTYGSPEADIAAINAVSAQTGVIAETANDGGFFYLIDDDGDDIVVQNLASTDNVWMAPLTPFSQRNTLILGPSAFNQQLDAAGGPADTFRVTGSSAISSEGYAEVTTSSGTYAFIEREKPTSGATLQVGAEKGQSVAVHVSSFDTDKLGGKQVIRTSIDIYGGAGASLAGVGLGSPGAHDAVSFRIIQQSTGATYDLDLGSAPYYYRSDFSWNKQLASAGLGDKLQVSMYEEDDTSFARFTNSLQFTAMEGFGDFDVVWSTAHGHSLPAGFSDGQSIINSSHVNHTQVAHAGTLSNLTTLSLEEQLKVIDTALDQVASRRAVFGATSNRLAYTISNLSSVSENTQSARSQIQDADFAVESARLAKSQLLQTTATAMIAQANASGSMVLQLIR